MKLNLNLRFGKSINQIAFLFMIIGLFVFPNFAQNSEQDNKSIRKRALLVGISKYDRPGKKDNWWNLNTKGDIELLANVLIHRFNFKIEDIKILCDEEVIVNGKKIPPTNPTHKLIVDTFRSFLIAKTKEGDVAYFHFSGHGQQIPDDKVDSNLVVDDELDGMDETIIPTDYVSTKDGSMNIRDDEIGILLGELSQQKPSNVTISLDSCYSGTATRGGIQRGSDWKGKPIDKSKVRGEDEDMADFVTRGGSRGGNSEQNYVFISAASQKQTAKEFTETDENTKITRSYGAFSYALAKAMESSGDKTTYRDLFQKVTDVITRNQYNQTPQIEGNFLDKILMKDGALPPQKFVNVKFSDKGIPYFAAGKLQGLTKGSKFNLCNAEAKECTDKDKITSVEIENVNPNTSTIKIEGNVTAEKLKTAGRAFEVFHNYEDVLKVAIKQEGRGNNAELESVFTNLGIVTKVSAEKDSWNVLIRQADNIDVNEQKVLKDFKGLVLQRSDGSIIKAISEDSKDATKQIQDALLAEANRLTVKSLGDTADSSLMNLIKLEMIPVECQKDEIMGGWTIGNDKPKEKLYSRGGSIILKEDDCVRLEITNLGKEDLYVTVLDLGPDGSIKAMFPSGNSENIVYAKGKPPFVYVRITKPVGSESFYAIVTKTPTDFTPLLSPEFTQRGNLTVKGQNAFDSPLGKILMNAQKGKRGEPIQPPASWATTSINFSVISKNDEK